MEQSEAGKYIEQLLQKYLPQSFSLRQASRTLGLDVGHLSRILSGKRELCVDTALALCIGLETNEDETLHLLMLAAEREAAIAVAKLKTRLCNNNLLSPELRRELALRLDRPINGPQRSPDHK
jgi:transcriptional regulator with XRE-family HTH domain